MIKCIFLTCCALHLHAGYILVVGGAGYIGSHVNERLYEEGFETIVLDNLSCGSLKAVRHGMFIEGNLGDTSLLDSIFTKHQVDAVMHFAAFLDVGESVRDPLKYYQNNVSETIALLQSMQKHQIPFFIFSSTAAIFGMTEESNIKEEHPCHPINPYGRSKLMVETILEDVAAATHLRYCCLRYFNAAGADPKGILPIYKKNQTNLIPTILRSIKQKTPITVFGTDFPTQDGTGVRDYVHIDDLATAHILALKQLMNGAPSTCYNLGNGTGFSVKNVIQTVEKVTGESLMVIYGPRREGDPALSLADSSKALKELGWEPKHTSLESMIFDTWKATLNLD